MQQKSQLLEESANLSLVTRFANLIDINPPAPLNKAGEVQINGDAHASFAILLIPLLQKGYISIAKNMPRKERLIYLRRLDEISASTNIDQLEIAGKNIEELRRESVYSDEQTKLLEGTLVSTELKVAEDHFNGLKTLVQDELDDFRYILGLITRECNCKILDLGDSTGDRGYCDLLMLETFFMFEKIDIEYLTLFSNHTLETLYALLTDKWAKNTSPAFIRDDFLNQIRSLRNFRVLLHYGLVSNDRKNELLSSWVQHINLLAYSYPEENTAKTSIYTHAPNDINSIINLAINYCKLPKDHQLCQDLRSAPKDSLHQHKLLRQLISEICTHFQRTFFSVDSARLLDKLVQYSRHGMRSNCSDLKAMYCLCGFTMQEIPIDTANLPDSMTFYHGHRSHDLMYEDSNDIPKNLVCLDNEYFKPADPCSATYYFFKVQFLEAAKFLAIPPQQMKTNTLYYSYINHTWTYKGKSDAASLDVDVYCEELNVVANLFSTTIEAEIPCCFSFLSKAPLPATPEFRAKFPSYSEYKSKVARVKVPHACKSATENFANFFTLNRVDISIFASRTHAFDVRMAGV